MKRLLYFLFFITFFHATAQDKKITETEIAVNPLINGTLFSPENPGKKTKLVIFIAGSGPTNRSGNQIGMQTNAYRYLAQALAKEGTAVFSYDKRIISQMIAGTLDEKTLSFEDFINDAKDVIAFFKDKKTYSQIIIAGHSEGSIIGTIAARNNTDAFISISGQGRSIDKILLEQLTKQSPNRQAEIQGYLDRLKNGETFEVTSESPIIKSMFRPSVQKYLSSWISYDPVAEIQKLKIPILIVGGTKDLQVPVLDAELLKKAKPQAKLEIIPNMNHVFKEIKGDETENKASYSNMGLPVMPELTHAINQFIKSL